MIRSKKPQDIVEALDADLLLKAYSIGIFPMADGADDPHIMWIKPETRGIIPLDEFMVPRSLKKVIKRGTFEIRFNTDFQGVIDGCAAPNEGRETTWINDQIRQAYGELFERRHCHTVEAWQDGKLVGGLYGVTLGAGFFGESMFSRVTDASKVCLVALVERLKQREFRLLDTQFTTDHLVRFGAIDVPRKRYEALLNDALLYQAIFSD